MYAGRQQLTVLGGPLGERQVLVQQWELVQVADDRECRRAGRHGRHGVAKAATTEGNGTVEQCNCDSQG